MHFIFSVKLHRLKEYTRFPPSSNQCLFLDISFIETRKQKKNLYYTELPKIIFLQLFCAGCLVIFAYFFWHRWKKRKLKRMKHFFDLFCRHSGFRLNSVPTSLSFPVTWYLWIGFRINSQNEGAWPYIHYLSNNSLLSTSYISTNVHNLSDLSKNNVPGEEIP